MTETQEFDKLLQKAVELRGHMCSGLPLGIKMAQMGLKLLNMTEAAKSENLMVFVETDACPAEAIKVATGCSVENGKLKTVNYAKSAASFVDSTTGKGIRVVSKKDLIARALKLATKDNIVQLGEKVEKDSKLERQILMNAYMKMVPEDLLDYQAVRITWVEPVLQSKKTHKKCGCGCGGDSEEEKKTVNNRETSKLYYELI
jgi:formylmethanofuran dehydrogenase subunit E